VAGSDAREIIASGTPFSSSGSPSRRFLGPSEGGAFVVDRTPGLPDQYIATVSA